MSSDVLPDNSFAILGGRLIRIHHAGSISGAKGYHVVDSTGDPGSVAGYTTTFTPAWCVKAAVVGETVCVTPKGQCFCGRAHVHADVLAVLPVDGGAA